MNEQFPLYLHPRRFEESAWVPEVCNKRSPIRAANHKTQPNVMISFFAKICYGSTSCWYWRGCRDKLGYGRFTLGKAHRVSYQIFKGEIPPKMSVLHRCDVRNCVNPDHLFLGNQLDNMRDAANKKRIKPPSFNGEKNPMAKYSEQTVKEIRAKFNTGKHSQRYLAKEYGMSFMNLNRIVRNLLWKHI